MRVWLKKMLVMLSVCLLSAAFTGCTLVSTDVTALISPPRLTTQQQAIEQALGSSLGGAQYTLTYPRSGDYRSSFVLHRFPGDSALYALAFYTLSSKDKAGTHVTVLKQSSGGTWKEVCDISGDGNEVNRIAFGNFNGTGADQIAVGWTSFTSTDMVLGVYALHGGKYEKVYRDTYTEMLPVSLSASNKSELLLLKLDSADKKATASLVSAVSGQMTVIGQAPLDSTVTGYAGLYATKEDGDPAVLIDSRKGSDTMVTEMVLWENGKLTSPLYDENAGTASSETLRSLSIDCRDIDGDGVIDIPETVELPGFDDFGSDSAGEIWNVRWMIWKNGALSVRCSSVVNQTEGYAFLFPNSWDNGTQNVTVRRAGSDADWAFYEWNAGTQQVGAKLFDILTYTDSAWEKEDAAGSSLLRIAESNGTVYVCRTAPDEGNAPDKLDISTIRSHFRLLS